MSCRADGLQGLSGGAESERGNHQEHGDTGAEGQHLPAAHSYAPCPGRFGSLGEVPKPLGELPPHDCTLTARTEANLKLISPYGSRAAASVRPLPRSGRAVDAAQEIEDERGDRVTGAFQQEVPAVGSNLTCQVE